MSTRTLCLLSLLSGLVLGCRPETPPPAFPEEPMEYPSEWLYDQRAYPHNRLNHAVWRQALRQTREALEAVAERSNLQWELVGPLNVGGRITDVALHPQDTNILYAGASVGGVWKSTDGGQSWTPIFDEVGALSIGDLALAPSDPDVLYVGTGEANGSATSGAFFGNGVYKSTDGGQTWQHLGLENSQHIGRIAVDPTNPDRVFVAAAGLLYGKSPDRGLYRSLDGGQNWEQVLFLSDSTAVIDVAIHPTQPDTLFAATWERIRFPWIRKYGGLTSGLWRSTDGGDTWERLGNGLPPPHEEQGRIGVAISPSHPEVVYAVFTTNAVRNFFDGLYKSTDAGNTWTRADVNGGIDNVFSSFGWFFGNVRVHPTDPEQVFVLGVPLVKSFDGGLSWQDWNNAMHVDQHGLEFHPLNPDFVVAGNDGGVYLSHDGGQTWEHVETLPITQFYNAEIDFLEPTVRFGGTQDNGTLMSFDLPDGWFRILGGDGFHVLVDPVDNNYVYAEFQFGNLFRSDQRGLDMEFIFAGENSDRTNWNTPIALDPSDPKVIYYGAHRLYRSTDRGNTFQPISPDLTDGPHPSGANSFGTLTTIAVAPSNPQTIWVGTDDGNVQVTFNGGMSWNNVSNGLPDRYVTTVAVHPEHDSTAFVTLSGFRYVDYQPHVLLTTDGGQSWQDISGNLPEIPVNDLVIDPDFPKNLFIANDLGVWFTQNLGQSWEPLGTQLPMTVVSDLVFHQPTRTLLAATFGRSMHQIDLSELTTSTGEAPPLTDSRVRLFPNPFASAASLQITLHRPTSVQVSWHSPEGRLLHTQHFAALPPGTHTLPLHVQTLPSGVLSLVVRTEHGQVSRWAVRSE